MKFCDQSWNFNNFVPQFYAFLLTFGNAKFDQRGCHGKSRNGKTILEKMFTRNEETLIYLKKRVLYTFSSQMSLRDRLIHMLRLNTFITLTQTHPTVLLK